VPEKSLLNASRLSYVGFGTHRCATEATCPYELRRGSATCIHRTSRTLTIRTSESGSSAVLSRTGKSVFVNKNGLIWLRPDQDGLTWIRQGAMKELMAYLMTMLSEIPSAVLPYSLKILIVFYTRNTKKVNAEKRHVGTGRTWRHYSLRHEKVSDHPNPCKRTQQCGRSFSHPRTKYVQSALPLEEPLCGRPGPMRVR